MFEADAHRLVRRTDARADFGTLRAGFKPILVSIQIEFRMHPGACPRS